MPGITDYFGKSSTAVNYAIATTVKTTRTAGVAVLEAYDLSRYATDTPVFFVTYKKTTDPVTGIVSVTNLISWKGLVNVGANTLTNLTLAPGYTDSGNAIGDFIECIPTSYWENSLMDGIFVGHNPDGTFKASAISAAVGVPDTTSIINPTGAITPYAGRFAPTGWLFCDGAAVSRTTYAALFASISPVIGTVTISIAAPGVGNFTAHGLKTGEAIHLTTTGTLPGGLSVTAQYFAIVVDANNIRFASTYANAMAGTAITTTGTQSGVHTLRYNPYGVGDGTTTFNVPDLRGRAIAGRDDMGGTSANRLTNVSGGLDGDMLGQAGGSETRAVADHSHTHFLSGGRNGTQVYPMRPDGIPGAFYYNIQVITYQSGGTAVGGSMELWKGTTDVAGAHTVGTVQPTMSLNYIVKT